MEQLKNIPESNQEKEKFYFHETSEDSVEGIKQKGFDPSKFNGTSMWGGGVYLSESEGEYGLGKAKVRVKIKGDNFIDGDGSISIDEAIEIANSVDRHDIAQNLIATKKFMEEYSARNPERKYSNKKNFRDFWFELQEGKKDEPFGIYLNKKLREMGYIGIRHLDAGMGLEYTGEGKPVLVVFDPKDIEIIKN